jgi:membrane fusion protein (multidrug efflux system)
MTEPCPPDRSSVRPWSLPRPRLDAPRARARRLLGATTLALLLVSGALVTGCKPAKGDMPAMPPPEVTTVAVKPEKIDVSYEYVGQTEGSREVEVRARVTGIVLERQYEEGAPVEAGEPLFLIDPVPFEVAVAQARAEVSSALARESQARREVARLKPLIAARAVSQREYDDAVSSFDIARANVQLAQARLREAELDLGYTRVTASVSGMTGRALKSEGSLVTANSDSLLTRVSQVDPIYVNFSLSEMQRLRIASEAAAGRLVLPPDGNLGVEIVLADGTTYGHKGRVNFSDARVDTTTGTIDARAVFPNPDRALMPGQFVRVRVNGASRPHAILVPQRAVLEGPDGKFVFVVRDGKAEPRPVQVGDWHDRQWIISQGLEEGDAVIVEGVVKVRPGAPVKVAGQPQAPVSRSKPVVPYRPGKPGTGTDILSAAEPPAQPSAAAADDRAATAAQA